MAHVERLTALRREYGRAERPFEIMLALLERPSPDLYKRAEDAGITAVMCAPWAAEPGIDHGTDVERFRPSIERFAESVVAKCR